MKFTGQKLKYIIFSKAYNLKNDCRIIIISLQFHSLHNEFDAMNRVFLGIVLAYAL